MLNKYIDRFQVNGYTISVKLPKSYFKSSNRDYSLLCVQDGDYLFKSIKKDLIFVGIESADRSNDFTPWQTQIGNEVNGGQADYYLTWLTETLIPLLRDKYRVSTDNKDIGIAGASYGALVSLYALYTMPENFGTYILISPSLWYPYFIDFMQERQPIQRQVNVYWYVGLKEGIKHTLRIKEMVPNSLEGVKILEHSLKNENSRFQFQTSRRGIHRHRFFKKYFNKALKFIYPR
ncbi:alpha/beta hydrolase [Staphylococcus durrellii]|uniref:alpha/beta hydrolase n=1 Tax=Staphylococcus durrellii TaxID=2781773 RepID=UPI00189F4EAC|nr:alpha/beta hydrolase-fold protein [Staphylococcus durrellii]MBF7015935.1 alpha/beta hydrolase [Staphylococcus durrellii]